MGIRAGLTIGQIFFASWKDDINPFILGDTPSLRPPLWEVVLQLSIQCRRAIFLAGLFMGTLLLSSCSQRADEKGVVYADLLARDKTIVAGQPIVVTLELRSMMDTVVELGPDGTGYLRFRIIDPSGRTSEMALPVPDFYGFTGTVILKRGIPYHQTINLAPILKADTPGVFQVKVELLPASKLSPDVVQGPFTAIRVSPPNPKELRLVCEALRRRIEQSSSAAERIEATSELASIHDPVAVASMRAILGRGFGVDRELIRSLGKIGNAEAIDALRVAVGGKDPDDALAARSSLSILRASTKDETIRRLASQALKQQ